MIDSKKFQREAEICGDSKEDTVLLKELAIEAKNYIGSFAWSGPIHDVYLVCGIGKVFALFLVEFEQLIQGRDKFLWVVVGDLPCAYMVTDLETPQEVVSVYVSLMESWARAVKHHKPLDAEFPVRSPANIANANALLRRTKLLKKNIIPHLWNRNLKV